MNGRGVEAWIVGAQTALLAISSLGLLGSLAVALLALIDQSDFVPWLWYLWISLPPIIVGLIVSSALFSRRSQPIAALLLGLVAALPGFGVLGFLAAMAAQ